MFTTLLENLDSIVNPPDTKAEGPKPDESYDETDRKQDEAIDSLAEQTKWIIN